MPFQRLARGGEVIGVPAQPDIGVLQDRQQGHRVERVDCGACDQPGQSAAPAARQRLAGRGVRDHAPARQLGRHAPRQRLVGRDQRCGPSRSLQGLAQQ